MNINPDELLGVDADDLSAKHALKEGAHDALSTVVQYGTIAAIVLTIGSIVLDKKTRNRIKNRWL